MQFEDWYKHEFGEQPNMSCDDTHWIHFGWQSALRNAFQKPDPAPIPFECCGNVGAHYSHCSTQQSGFKWPCGCTILADCSAHATKGTVR